MDRKELVEKMLDAFYGKESSIRQPKALRDGMDAALSVAIDELLKDPSDEELDAVEHSWIFDSLPGGIRYRPSDVAQKVRDAACIFNSKRRAKLERVKTPEERVTIQSHTTCTAVMLDGKIDCMLNGPREAEIYRLGLIQQLKEKN